MDDERVNIEILITKLSNCVDKKKAKESNMSECTASIGKVTSVGSGTKRGKNDKKSSHHDSDKENLGFIRSTEQSDSVSDPLSSVDSKTSSDSKVGHMSLPLHGVRQVDRVGEIFVSQNWKPGQLDPSRTENGTTTASKRI